MDFFTMCATVFAPRGGIDDAGFRGYLQRQIAANLGVNPSLTICALTERAMSFIPDAAAGGVR